MEGKRTTQNGSTKPKDHTREREILDAINEACFELDDNGIIQFANRKAVRLFGRDGEEMTGENFLAIFPEADDVRVHDAIYAGATGKKPYVQLSFFSAATQQQLHINISPVSGGCV